MTLTFASLTIEITRGHLYVDLTGRSAVFIEFGTGLPWGDFARRRSGTDKFFSTEETRLYLEELERVNPTKKGEYLEANRGRYGGTWAHPKLAVFFARWLDVRFSVWCDAVIEDILKGAAEVSIVRPEESAAPI